MTELLAGPAWLLAALLVLLVVVLCGPERVYLRALELLRALRGGGTGQRDTAPPPRQDADSPPS